MVGPQKLLINKSGSAEATARNTRCLYCRENTTESSDGRRFISTERQSYNVMAKILDHQDRGGLK